MAEIERGGATHSAGMPARLVGGLLAVVGLALLAGGVWLLLLGGSAYYALAGAGLLASAFYLFRLKIIGAWIYVGVFALTVPWSLWETGADAWALVPRLVGPAILLALVALVSPWLDRGPRWPTALMGAGVAIASLGVVLWGAAEAGPHSTSAVRPASLALVEGDSVGDDWPAWGGTYAGQRFSPLNQITRVNVDRLEKAWVAHTGDLPQGAAKGKYAAETTPLKIGNRLYLCSAMNILIALDARSGAEIWRFDPKVSAAAIPYSASCRGVTAYRRESSTPRLAIDAAGRGRGRLTCYAGRSRLQPAYHRRHPRRQAHCGRC